MAFGKPFRAVPIKEGRLYPRKRRFARAQRIGIPVVVLSAAAVVGVAIGVTPSVGLPALRHGYDNIVSGCSCAGIERWGTDGDKRYRCSSCPRTVIRGL